MFELSWRDSERIAVVTLASPPANAFGPLQVEEFDQLLERFARERRLRAIVFTSASRFFSAGADINVMAEAMRSPDGPQRMADFGRRMQKTFATVEAIEVPTFAAISGICVGGGLELALACDFRVAEKEAVLGLPEIKIGLLPGAGGTQRLVAIAGRGVATQLIMTGDLISGERAEKLGVVQEVTGAGQALERSLDLARAVIAAPRRSLAAIKRCLTMAPSPEGFEAEVAETLELHKEPQTRERITAFLDRTSKKRVAV